MFTDLSWAHTILLLIVALVVVGPKDLPKLMRKIGQWTAKARGMADQFRSSFDDMARQSELDELRKELDELRTIRPLAETERQINEALAPPEVSLSPEPAPAEAPTEAPAAVHDEPPPASAEPAELLPHPDQPPPP
jgi:sec-independent protein translocase protein TatB